RNQHPFRQRGTLDPVKTLSIQLFFQYRWWHRHSRLVLRYGRPLEQRTVDLNVVRRHENGGKSLLEAPPNGAAIERNHSREHPHGLVHRIDDGAGDALVDDFRNGTM